MLSNEPNLYLSGLLEIRELRSNNIPNTETLSARVWHCLRLGTLFSSNSLTRETTLLAKLWDNESQLL
jgi:hypothetical protein